MAAAAGAGTPYLRLDQLEIGKFYKIELPYTVHEIDRRGRYTGEIRRGKHKYIGKYSRGPPVMLFTDMVHPNIPFFPVDTHNRLDSIISVAPIDMADPNDTALRISPSAIGSTATKALAGLPDELSSKVRGFMGGKKKSRKSRRKGKKTLRRK